MLCTDCLKNEATLNYKKQEDGLCLSCRKRKGKMGYNYIPIKDAEEKKRLRSIEINEIEKEVNERLENCYTEHNCNVYTELHNEDIIETVSNLKELYKNSKKLITEIKNRLDIIERYRIDINHENEIENIENNDELAIYTARKEHVLNKKRRELKDRLQIYELIEQLINKMKSSNSVEDNFIESLLNKITEEVKKQSERSYIPYVDLDMVDKYDWCIDTRKKYVTKKKQIEYKVTAFKTNLNKGKFNEPIEMVITAYSEEQAISRAKEKLGLNIPTKRSHNIFSNFKAERMES